MSSYAKLLTAVATATAALSSDAFAQVDTIRVIAPSSLTVGGVSPSSPLAAFGYVPASGGGTDDKLYTTGFTGLGQDIRVIENVSSGSPTFTRLIQVTAWTQFMKDGDPNRGGGVPSPNSLILNRTPIGSIPAFGAAFISDSGGQVSTSGTSNPELTQRIYRFNLQQDTNGDAREELTSLVTLKQMQDAIGSTTSSSGVGRQVALSTDSSKVYFTDSSPAYGGLWTVPSTGGTVTRILTDADLQSEPTVVQVNGTDRVILRGTVGSGNDRGLDSFDTGTAQRTNLLPIATLASFLETNATDVNIVSTTADADGNIYFNSTDNSPERRGIYMLDPQGRLIKIISKAERDAVFGTTQSNTLRMQPRTTTFEGPNGPFALTQILYTESTPLNTVAGAFVFKPGDFNRDNAVTAADLAAFGAKLTPRGQVAAVADSRYDLNGNNVIDFKDVKVLQSFLLFPDGDANFDNTTNFADLVRLAQNYNVMTGRTWIQGDFNGDDAVNFADLVTLAQNYNKTGGPVPIGSLGAAFAADWALAQSMVPEPTTAIALLAVAGLAGNRKRNRR